MNKKNIKNIIYTISLSILGFVPFAVFGATIDSSAVDSVFAGDTSIINVYLNTEGEQINSIDGSVTITDEHGGNFEIKDLSIANSALTMWPSKPSLEEGHKINFVAGVPGGVSGERLLLFKIITKINEEGNLTITPMNSMAYLNDGIPTKIDIKGNTSKIKVGPKSESTKNKWEELISNDNSAPQTFTITLGSDPYLYNGKKFVHFETTDAESGISHYMVTEGDREPVRSGTDYVLIEQDKKVDIIVAAYDKAGNFQIAVLKTKSGINWASIIIAVFIIYFGVKIIRKIIKVIKKKRDVQ